MGTIVRNYANASISLRADLQTAESINAALRAQLIRLRQLDGVPVYELTMTGQIKALQEIVRLANREVRKLRRRRARSGRSLSRERPPAALSSPPAKTEGD